MWISLWITLTLSLKDLPVIRVIRQKTLNNDTLRFVKDIKKYILSLIPLLHHYSLYIRDNFT